MEQIKANKIDTIVFYKEIIETYLIENKEVISSKWKKIFINRLFVYIRNSIIANFGIKYPDYHHSWWFKWKTSRTIVKDIHAYQSLTVFSKSHTVKDLMLSKEDVWGYWFWSNIIIWIFYLLYFHWSKGLIWLPTEFMFFVSEMSFIYKQLIEVQYIYETSPSYTIMRRKESNMITVTSFVTILILQIFYHTSKNFSTNEWVFFILTSLNTIYDLNVIIGAINIFKARVFFTIDTFSIKAVQRALKAIFSINFYNMFSGIIRSFMLKLLRDKLIQNKVSIIFDTIENNFWFVYNLLYPIYEPSLINWIKYLNQNDLRDEDDIQKGLNILNLQSIIIWVFFGLLTGISIIWLAVQSLINYLTIDPMEVTRFEAFNFFSPITWKLIFNNMLYYLDYNSTLWFRELISVKWKHYIMLEPFISLSILFIPYLPYLFSENWGIIKSELLTEGIEISLYLSILIFSFYPLSTENELKTYKRFINSQGVRVFFVKFIRIIFLVWNLNLM